MRQHTDVDHRVDELIARLHDQAQAATRLSDFGDTDYEDGLRQLVDSLAAIPDIGDDAVATLATQLILGILVARLRTEEQWRRHPDCLRVDLGSPVFIIGIPRTGTTALHQLLSVDPQFQVSQRWLQSYPKPRPPRDAWDDDPDYRAAVDEIQVAPMGMLKDHFVAPHEADECLVPMAQTFVSNFFGSQASIPAYDEWMLARDMTPSFSRYANFLRLLGSTSPGQSWLLKNPSHVLSLDELFTVFPGARVIQTHRHPQTALGSVVSLLCAIGELIGHRRPPQEVARREIALWAEGMRRSADARRGREASFYDMDYRKFVADPLAVAHDVYRAFDLEMTDDVERSMRRWVDEHPKDQHGGHTYDPEALGVDRRAIDEHFGPYIEEHGLS